MSEVDCPVGGCEYSGEPKSVEAHISSSTSGEHSGKSGSEHRDELRDGSSGENSGIEEPEEPGPLGSDGEAVGEEAAKQQAEEEGKGGDSSGALLIGVVLVALFLFGQSSGLDRSGL